MPSWEEYWGKGGINDQKIASGAGDAIKSSKPSISTPASSYTGSSNIIGSVSGSKDLSKSYQDLYNSTRNDTNQNSQLNTWADKNGSVYDTTPMTAQQIFALSLAKDGNQNASAILRGMGLDMNGNPVSAPSYGVNPADLAAMNAGKTPMSTSQTQSSTYRQPMQQGTMVPLSNNPADYTQGGKYYSPPAAAPTQAQNYDVNDPAFQALDGEERKKILLSNPQLLQQELERASKVWFDNDGKNPEKQRLAHAWAEELRAAAANQPQHPQQQPGAETGQSTGVPEQDPNATDFNDPAAVAQWIGNIMKQTIGAGTNPNDAYWKDQKAASDLEQQGIFNTKTSQYQNLLESLKTGQKNDLKFITDGIDSATNKIEDKSFQDWLAARQNAASRGLAGSGLASDQNTRLLLSKQRDLADMFTQKNTALNDVNKRYSDSINTAQSGIANTNLNAMQAAAFQKLFKDGQGSLNDQFKTFADLFNNTTKNNITSEGDKLKAITEKYSTDVKYKYLYDKLDSDTKQKTAQLQLDWEKYGLDVTKVFGQDAAGNPTLDARKMVAEISQKAQQMAITQAHNAVTENQGWARIGQADQEMSIKLQAMENQTEQFKQRMKLDTSKAGDAQLGKQVDAIKSIMTTEGSNLRSLRTQLDSKNLTDAQKTSLQSEYAQSLSKIEAAQNSMGEIYKFKTGDTPSYSGDAPKPFNMNDMDEYGDEYDSIG